MVRLLPRDVRFFDLFADIASNVLSAAKLLHEVLNESENVEARIRKIKELETSGDEQVRSLFTKLSHTFITPLDRDEIHRLAIGFDEVLDKINAVAEIVVLYKVHVVPGGAVQMAEFIVRQVEQLRVATNSLAHHGELLQRCIEINRLEEHAQRVMRESIGRLYEHERNSSDTLKLRDLFHALEQASDQAGNCADVLESIVLKGS
jgi:uncharacterized protein